MPLLFLGGSGDIGLLALRITLGLVFLYHSMGKLRMPGMMAKGMGMSIGMIVMLGIVEFLSSLAIIFGFLTQIAAIILGLIMIGAIFMKIGKWRMPFGVSEKPGWALDLVFFGAAIALLFLGAGGISLDALFGWIA